MRRRCCRRLIGPLGGSAARPGERLVAAIRSTSFRSARPHSKSCRRCSRRGQNAARGVGRSHAALADAPTRRPSRLRSSMRAEEKLCPEARGRAELVGRSLARAAAAAVARFGTSNEHSGLGCRAPAPSRCCNAVHQPAEAHRPRSRPPRCAASSRRDAAVAHPLPERFRQRRLPEEDALTRCCRATRASIGEASHRAARPAGARCARPRGSVARALALSGHPARGAHRDARARAVAARGRGFPHAPDPRGLAVRQWREWGDTAQGRRILVAVPRAGSPRTRPRQRAALQTAGMSRGDSRAAGTLHEEAS